MRTRTRILLITAGALATAGLLAGCTANSTGMGNMPGMDHGAMPMTAPSAANSTADVMFVQMMIPHHQQAIQMADTILGKQGIPQSVLDLATKIKAAQGPEITTMQGWLTAWGQPTSSATDGMGMGSGMMSDTDMQALDAATGTAAAKLFLTQMIAHHQGAITMARDELANGTDVNAKALAQQIIDTQTAEIATMQSLLTTL
jgi:uncharacterized protein (DUF305 family)